MTGGPGPQGSPPRGSPERIRARTFRTSSGSLLFKEVPRGRGWGQVLGIGDGVFGVVQGASRKGEDSRRKRRCRNDGAGSRFPVTRRPSRNLDGKEGVDGSSPSEGSGKRKIPGNRGFCCLTQHHRVPPHSRREAMHLAARLQSPCKSSCCPVPRSTSLPGRGFGRAALPTKRRTRLNKRPTKRGKPRDGLSGLWGQVLGTFLSPLSSPWAPRLTTHTLF